MQVLAKAVQVPTKAVQVLAKPLRVPTKAVQPNIITPTTTAISHADG